MAYQQTKTLLRKQGLAPTKKLGQNFLVHRHTAERIVELARISADDTVLEIGVGLGALTGPLAAAARNVIGLEADSGIVRLHDEQGDLPDNVRLIHQDVLKADFEKLYRLCNQKLKIIANLPYSISSPFLFRLIEHHNLMESAVIMLQKEVGLRLTAQPGTREYGVPTVLLASCAAAETLMQVGPEEFHPRPKVDSIVCRLTFHPRPARVESLGSFDFSLFRRVVNGAFGQRRKTLLNALSATGLLDRQHMQTAIEKSGLVPSIRAERLTLENFVHLTRAIEQAINHKASCPVK
jgi:16S rRNA (adenine1518-N6/adenine1519-N6)-dimethyltransferase